MRLDKYLKVSRIIKRRTVAKETATAGIVSVNGKIVKASYDVQIGDEITIDYPNHIMKVRVQSVTPSIKKQDSLAMYEVLTNEKKEG